jgi:spore maturation protein CgeB
MFKSLLKIPGLEPIYFDCCDFNNPKLKEENNRSLIELIEKEKPDLFFHLAYTDQITPETLKYIKNKTKTTTMNWFCDDVWRFDAFTKEWCWYFDYSITMGKDTVEKYHKIGYQNVLVSQWAVNPELFQNLHLAPKFDVSFVGQPHGQRREIIKTIKEAGINIKTFGYGWKSNGFTQFWNRFWDQYPSLKFKLGKLSNQEMIRVFNQSKINLNLSASSGKNTPDQFKARNFEVPGCGGFLLTSKVKYLEEYYEIGKEIICYDNLDDMIDKMKYYLSHEEERQKIGEAGYQRTLRDHTYEKRFKEILNQVKLKA